MRISEPAMRNRLGTGPRSSARQKLALVSVRSGDRGWLSQTVYAISSPRSTYSRRHSQVVRRGSANLLALEIEQFRLDPRNPRPGNTNEDSPAG